MAQAERDVQVAASAAPRKPKITEAYVLDEWHDLIEEGRECAICGDAFEVGQRAIWVPAGYGPKNAIVAAHLGCAVNGDEVDLTSEARAADA